jgi:large subunit ribosomal protein L17
MRHRVRGRKLGRPTPHRRALLRNLCTSLLEHERITTTVQKAKEVRPLAEKMITLGKKETLHARRQAARFLLKAAVVKKLFDTIAARYADRAGGYTRIVKLGHRSGDGAELAVIELLGSELSVKKAERAAAEASRKEKSGKKLPETAEGKESDSMAKRVSKKIRGALKGEKEAEKQAIPEERSKENPEKSE